MGLPFASLFCLPPFDLQTCEPSNSFSRHSFTLSEVLPGGRRSDNLSPRLTFVGYRYRNRARIAWASLLALPFVLASCSRRPHDPISRTYHVSGEKLAQIRSNPNIRRALRGPNPSARLAGLGDDRWPPGILFLDTDPYLEELGFDKGKMIAEINGKKAQNIFLQQWRKNPGGFEQDHYKDLLNYLFIEHNWNEIVLTVYLDVPRSYDEILGYKPKIEHWLVKIG